MLEEYKTEFREMYEKIKNGNSPLEVMKDNYHLFRDEGIGLPGIAHYLMKYVKQEEAQ